MPQEHNRQTGTRTPLEIGRIKLTFEDAKKRFDESMKDLDGLKSIYNKMKNEPNLEEVWLEDILRSQIVLMVSALDYYMHEVLEYGLLKFFNGDWEDKNEDEDKKILNTYKIPIKVIKDIWIVGNNQSDNCKREIVKAINKVFYGETLQRFDKIKAHLVRFGITLPESFDKYERKIIEICKRRNKIAHASDRYEFTKDLNQGKTRISEEEIDGYKKELIEFVDLIQKSIINRQR